MTLGHCESCAARVIFSTSPLGVERVVDADPHEDGNVLLGAHGSLRLDGVDRASRGSVLFREHECGEAAP